MKKQENRLVANKKAFFDYEIIETFEAGMVLKGTEIKSLRNGGGSLQDAYIIVKQDQLLLLQSYIAPYAFGSSFNHEERRERNLLMHKKEIIKLKKASLEKSLSFLSAKSPSSLENHSYIGTPNPCFFLSIGF